MLWLNREVSYQNITFGALALQQISYLSPSSISILIKSQRKCTQNYCNVIGWVYSSTVK